MASSKYERELRFIATETVRLEKVLKELKEALPDTPADAQKNAEEIEKAEETMVQMMARKKEIEDSFVAAGLEVPDINRSLNENGCRDTVSDKDYVKPEKPAPVLRPAAGEDELSKQIADITDELMQLEIKMLRADMDGNDAEKQKLGMCADTLRSRRDSLVAEMKELKAEAPAPAPAENVSSQRMDTIEADNRALRSQISDIRSDVTDMKEQLRQILEALRLDEN